MEGLKSALAWAKTQGFLVGYTREDQTEGVLFVDADQVLGLSQKLSMPFGDTLAGVILFKVARAVLLKSGAITPDTPKLEASMKAWEFVEAAYTGVYPTGWTKVRAAQLETCKKVSKTAPADKAGKIRIVRVRVNQNAPGYLNTTVKSSSGLGRLVAPTWDMVLGFKNHQSSDRFAGTPPITWEEYTLQYMEILERNVTEDVARKIAAHASNEQLSIACYCRLDTECCHNALLKSFLEEKYPQYFSTTTGGTPPTTPQGKKVFIGGSRSISSLSPAIKARLQSLITHGYTILVGDSYGVDKAVQTFFAQAGYSSVVVYCTNSCRNNVGGWPVMSISSDRVEKDFHYYKLKDIEASRSADFGLMIWDGKSRGTLNDILMLVGQGKTVLVFLGDKEYYVRSEEDVSVLGKK